MNLYEKKILNIRKAAFEKMINLNVEKLLKLTKDTSETLLFNYDPNASIISNVFYSVILNKKTKSITLIDATNHEKIQTFESPNYHEIYSKILIKTKRVKSKEDLDKTQQKVTIGPDGIGIQFHSQIDFEVLTTTEFLSLIQTINNANIAIYNILVESQTPTILFENKL